MIRSGGRTVFTSRWNVDEAANRVRRGCAKAMGVAEPEVHPSDAGRSFNLLRGSVDYGRGVRIRTMVRALGEVRPLADGSEIIVRFRPHWEVVAWMMFSSLLTIIGFVALIASLVTGSGPLLWPVAGTTLFGGFTAWKVNQLSSARRDLESELRTWLEP